MPIIDFGPRPCPADCGQTVDLETWTGLYYRSGGPYPDEMIESWEDDTGRVISICTPEPPARFFADAWAHWLAFHGGA